MMKTRSPRRSSMLRSKYTRHLGQGCLSQFTKRLLNTSYKSEGYESNTKSVFLFVMRK